MASLWEGEKKEYEVPRVLKIKILMAAETFPHFNRAVGTGRSIDIVP
jgi:hypothetical protein